MNWGGGTWAALAIACACLSPAAASPAALGPDPNAIHWDPGIRRGVLANGLRYAVMRGAVPSGGLSIRLGVDVGSLDETEAERGAAHFVEHMAFGGAHAVPGADLEATFTAAGVAFGRDRNAETGYEATTYRIDLPHADEKAEALAFRWLRAVADGTQFTDASVAHERGVILAEREARLTAAEASAHAIQAFLAKGLLFPDRDPIGTPQSLAAMTPQRLSAFYGRWYRPANAVVVVVGDRPVDDLAKEVEAAFAGWKGGGEPRAPRSMGALDTTRGPAALVLADPVILPTEAEVCRIHDAPTPRPTQDVARLRAEAATQLWSRILGQRLAMLAQANSGILSATVETDPDARRLAGACIRVVPALNDWRRGLDTVETQLRRFAQAPPSEDELEAAIKEARAHHRGGIQQSASRDDATLASAITADLLVGDVTPSPSEAFRAYDAAVADITPADIAAAFARDWSGTGPLIAVITPQPPTREAVLAAWQSAGASALAAAPAAAPAPQWAYDNFGKPGRVVRRQAFTKPDFVRLTFANGVILNVMQTAFTQDQEGIAVAFGDGRRDIPDADLVKAQMGALLLKQGGLGRHDAAQVSAIFAESGAETRLAMGDDTFLLQGASGRYDLRRQLQLLAAYMTDPGFRNLDPLLGTIVETMYRAFRKQPSLVVALAVNQAIAPGNPLTLPPQAEMARIRAADFEQILKPVLTQAPIEVSLVGGIDEKAAAAAVADTFGALPPRQTKYPQQPHTWFLRFPPGAIGPIAATHEGPPEKAIIGMIWPLYVAEPSRRREEYALNLTADLLSDGLRHRLRDELGKTYAPAAVAQMPDFGDQGFLLAVVETAPTDVALVRDESAKVAERIARGDFTDADLEAVRAPRLAGLTARARTNGFWLMGLAGSSTHPGLPAEVADMSDLYASITAADVRRAAADWLARAPIVVVAMPAATALASNKP